MTIIIIMLSLLDYNVLASYLWSPFGELSIIDNVIII